jgi:cell division protein FtsQ
MSFKNNIRKILFVTMWCVAGAGMLVLLIAAINKRNSKACKGYKIAINGNSKQLFLNNKIIENIITDSNTKKIESKSISTFDLKNTEDKLKQNVWVKSAELFFDNNEMLRINITEREPIARIFTVAGNTFYIDSSGTQLPVPLGLPVKLPVFTSYPYEKIKMHDADSILLNDMKTVGNYILNDSFWMAQIDQIDITSSKTFEMTPVVGNQTIEFGDGSDYKAKFARLFIFYKDVLSKTGFNKYSKINVQYKGQIIGTKKGGAMIKSDSLKFIKSVQQLIQSAQQIQLDTARQNIKPLENNSPQEQLNGDEEFSKNEKDSSGNKKQETRIKEQESGKPKQMMKPKAVMPKKGKLEMSNIK